MTKAEISMRRWRSSPDAASQGAFARDYGNIAKRYFLHKKRKR